MKYLLVLMLCVLCVGCEQKVEEMNVSVIKDGERVSTKRYIALAMCELDGFNKDGKKVYVEGWVEK